MLNGLKIISFKSHTIGNHFGYFDCQVGEGRFPIQECISPAEFHLRMFFQNYEMECLDTHVINQLKVLISNYVYEEISHR